MLTRFPYVFGVEFQINGRKRPCVHFSSSFLEFDIPEVGGGHALLVAKWNESWIDGDDFLRKSAEVHVRLYNGDFYAPLAAVMSKTDDIDALASAELPRPGSKNNFLHTSTARILGTIYPGRHSAHTSTALREFGMAQSFLIGNPILDSDPLPSAKVISKHSRKEEVREKLAATLANLIIVDGEVLMKCSQPRLVQRVSGPREGDAIVALNGAGPFSIMPRFGAPIASPLETTVSSLAEPVLIRGNITSRQVDDIFVLMDSVLAFDVRGEALARAAELVAEAVRGLVGDFPPDAVRAFMGLGEALRLFRDTGRHEALEQAVAAALDTFPENLVHPTTIEALEAALNSGQRPRTAAHSRPAR